MSEPGGLKGASPGLQSELQRLIKNGKLKLPQDAQAREQMLDDLSEFLDQEAEKLERTSQAVPGRQVQQVRRRMRQGRELSERCLLRLQQTGTRRRDPRPRRCRHDLGRRIGRSRHEVQRNDSAAGHAGSAQGRRAGHHQVGPGSRSGCRQPRSGPATPTPPPAAKPGTARCARGTAAWYGSFSTIQASECSSDQSVASTAVKRDGAP